MKAYPGDPPGLGVEIDPRPCAGTRSSRSSYSGPSIATAASATGKSRGGPAALGRRPTARQIGEAAVSARAVPSRSAAPRRRPRDTPGGEHRDRPGRSTSESPSGRRASSRSMRYFSGSTSPIAWSTSGYSRVGPNEPERNAIGRRIRLTTAEAPSADRISAATPKPIPANATPPSSSTGTSEPSSPGPRRRRARCRARTSASVWRTKTTSVERARRRGRSAAGSGVARMRFSSPISRRITSVIARPREGGVRAAVAEQPDEEEVGRAVAVDRRRRRPRRAGGRASAGRGRRRRRLRGCARTALLAPQLMDEERSRRRAPRRRGRGRRPRASGGAPRAPRARGPRRAPPRSARASTRVGSSVCDDDLAPVLAGSGSRLRRRRRSARAGVPMRDELARAEDGDPVGELLRLVEVVRRQEDRLAERAQRAHDLPGRRGALPGRSRSSARRGRPARDRRRARRRGRAGASVRPRASSPARRASRASPTSAITSSTSRGLRVVARRTSRAPRGRVSIGGSSECCSTTPIRSRRARPPCRVEPEHLHLAAVARAVALEDLDRRRLAGAVRPEQAEHLAARDLEVDPAQRLDAVVGLAQPADAIAGVTQSAPAQSTPPAGKPGSRR